jgi:type IV pilus assembly protein PilA
MSTTVKKLQTKKKNKKGFTLVELVIVIAVLAIIAAIAIPTVTNVIGNANKSHDESDCQAVELAIKTAHSEVEAGNAPVGYDSDTTVATILKDNGIAVDTSSGSTGLPKLKTKGYAWEYDSTNGKIYVHDAPAGAKALSNSTKLSDIFPNT